MKSEEIEYDQQLMNDVMGLSGSRSLSETVERALRFYLKMRRQEELLRLRGQVLIDPAYDYKAERTPQKELEKAA